MSKSPESAVESSWPGLVAHEILARQFRALRFLGAGPDGTAIAATRRDGGAAVELRFGQDHAQSDQLLERWARYQLVAHPHVISLEHVESAGSDWCAVLGTAPLENLEQALGTAWSVDASLRVLQQVSAALGAAHDVGLWHGDLRPATVLLDGKRGARLEFTGVAIWGSALPGSGVGRDWRKADACEDILQLGLLAEQLFGGVKNAHAHLPWLTRLAAEDPCRRPAAVEVEELLRQSAESVRRAAQARLELQTLDTERPVKNVAASKGELPKSRRVALTPLGTPVEGARVGRFQLERLLGEGGMGSVYKAIDVASGQHVALKLLKRELLDDEAVRYRFKKEARVLKAVQSPYVANLIEADMSDSYGYIALEFVDGKDLATLLEKHGPLSESVALQIVADVCRALVEPHRRGIVHRDIKPQNVLLVGDLGQPHELVVKLCDFGIASAKLSAETVGMTRDGRLWGTPQYMAPEQCTCAPVSPATDVYALGLTLFELIVGRPVFEGDELMHVLRQQMSEPARNLSECANVSEGTAALVACALEKAEARRHVDAAALLEAIELVRNGQAAALSAQPAWAGGRSFELEFSIELTSSPAELWPYVSDTDRMNEVVGLPPVQVERGRVDGVSKVLLSNKVLGIDMRWQEYPFEWVEGHKWSVLRVFEKGLTRWYRVQMELEPLPAGGTRLRYSMEFEPIFAFLAFLIKLEVGVKQKAKLLAIFKRVDALIQKGSVRRSPSPHAEPKRREGKLTRLVASKLDGLRSEGVGEVILDALEKHILDAPDVEIARLRPLCFARVHGLDERAFTEACLLGARQGLFNLLWDVVCPLCQIPATFAESLQRLETHSSCPACELSFPLNFAESVELVFRVAPEVRPNEVKAYCIGGPAHSPHVAAQMCLGPGEGRVLSLELSAGRHRLRSPQLAGVIELDVSSAHAASRADVAIGSRLRVVRSKQGSAEDARLALSPAEPTLELASGRQILGVRNELQHEVTLRLERTAERDDALTAARAWSMPRFRELFPGETLESGRLVSVGQLSFLVLRVMDHLELIEARGDAAALAATLRVFDQLQVVAEAHQGRLTGSTMDVALAVFERSEDALRACLGLAKVLADESMVGCSLALHRGVAVATTINDRMEYYGRTLAEVLELSATARPRQLVMSSVALREGDLARIPGTPVVRPVPMLGPAAWCVYVDESSPPVLAQGEAAA